MDSVGRTRIYHIFPARHIADLLDIYPERVQKPEAVFFDVFKKDPTV